MDSSREQLLLERIRSDDTSAFKTLHEQYYLPLYELACKKLGDEDDAYDLLQEMFLELWEKRATFFISNPLYNYLKNRLWFKLSGHFRKKGFHEKHMTAFAAFLDQESVTDPNDEQKVREIELQYDLLMAHLEMAVAQMPARMREVFTLSRNGELSITEIAEKLGLSPKTVSNHLHMAMDRIRRTLSEQGISALEILILMWLTKN